MCRLIRNHPIKSIFLLIVIVSCVHLTHKLLLTNITYFTLPNTQIVKPLYDNNRTVDAKFKISFKYKLPMCEVNMDKLKTSVEVVQTAYSQEELEARPWAANLTNGSWSPPNCNSSHKVAIIIPYRNRKEHLKIFLNHIHPFLQKQLISYGIFVIEQAPGTRFNRAALFNAGYKEASTNSKIGYNCFIFHDVDLLPSNERNFYTCSSSPLHLSVAIDKFNYKLPYQAIFGGAVALSQEHFEKVNGFSNIFFGWGGEDDDMSSRLSFKKLVIHRYPNSVARYIMIKHNVDAGNPINPMRFKLLKTSQERHDKDGIKSLEYTLVNKKGDNSTLYRLITVQFPEKELLKKWNL